MLEIYRRDTRIGDKKVPSKKAKNGAKIFTTTLVQETVSKKGQKKGNKNGEKSPTETVVGWSGMEHCIRGRKEFHDRISGIARKRTETREGKCAS